MSLSIRSVVGVIIGGVGLVLTIAALSSPVWMKCSESITIPFSNTYTATLTAGIQTATVTDDGYSASANVCDSSVQVYTTTLCNAGQIILYF